jgi:hypothetical protein
MRLTVGVAAVGSRQGGLKDRSPVKSRPKRVKGSPLNKRTSIRLVSTFQEGGNGAVLSDDQNKVSYSELVEARRPTVEFYLPGHFPVTGFLCHSHTTTGGSPLFPTLLAPTF